MAGERVQLLTFPLPDKLFLISGPEEQGHGKALNKDKVPSEFNPDFKADKELLSASQQDFLK